MLNEEAITEDLNNNWNVIAEALQTILRRELYPDPYETLLELTRKNKAVSQESLNTFIDDLSVSEKVKEEMRKISPFTYTGIDTGK